MNEVLYDPPSGSIGDANGDGTRDPNEDEFVEWDYHDKVYPGNGTNINLSDVLYSDPNFIWDKIDSLLGSPINREWCTPALITWRHRWT